MSIVESKFSRAEKKSKNDFEIGVTSSKEALKKIKNLAKEIKVSTDQVDDEDDFLSTSDLEKFEKTFFQSLGLGEGKLSFVNNDKIYELSIAGTEMILGIVSTIGNIFKNYFSNRAQFNSETVLDINNQRVFFVISLNLSEIKSSTHLNTIMQNILPKINYMLKDNRGEAKASLVQVITKNEKRLVFKVSFDQVESQNV